MADQDQQNQAVDTDYSGRPYQLPSIEELMAAELPPSPYDIVVTLPDGRIAADTGRGYYIVGDDGWPDWNQPVYLPGLSTGPERGERIERA